MTSMPLPSILGNEGSEVCVANVGDGSGEPDNINTPDSAAVNHVLPEQSAGVLLPVCVGLFLSVRTPGQTVLLHGTLEQRQGLVLQVCRGHQVVEVWLEVSLVVSAGHCSDVSVTLARTEEMPQGIVTTLQHTGLVTTTLDTTDHPAHVSSPEHTGLHSPGSIA